MPPSDRPVFNDRYEVSSRIGRGGMADVYLARDRLLDRPVAVKVLFPEFAADPSFVERFRREAQSAANLSHPNIVGVYDWGKQGNTYFIVMEYVNGRSLAEIIRADGVIQPQRGAEIAADVAAALSFAHSTGVIHRDIKPGNILVSPSGAVKVADFGIARALNTPTEHDLTQAGAVMGTATYFSPEQAQGTPSDQRSDLYSLGIVMYEMAVGNPPFSGDNPVAIAYKQVHEMPRPIADAMPGIPAGYEAITMRLLAKQPANRFATADELRLALKRFRDGVPMPIDSFPPDPPARAPSNATTRMEPTTPPSGTQILKPVAATQMQPRQAPPQPPRPVPQPARQAPAAAATYVPEEPNRTGWYVAAAVLTVVLLGIAAFALVKALGSHKTATPTDQVNVPNVTQMSLDDAKKELIKFRLTPEPVAQANAKFGANVVFDQEPKPDVPVDRGTVVRLIYNPAATKKSVPSLIDKTVEEAQAILKTLDLAADLKQIESPDKPAGIVVAQQPGPGDVEAGTRITLTVSVGKGKVIVPNVATFDQARASNELGQKGLSITLVSQADETIEKGRVVGTDPPAGTEVEKNAVVKLIISDGPAPVAVPDVGGLDELDAINKLTAAGFVPTVTRTESAAATVGKVLSQNPLKGVKAAKKSTVTIEVGKPTPVTTTTTTTIAPAPAMTIVTNVKIKASADPFVDIITDPSAPYEFTWQVIARNTGTTKLTGITLTSSTVPACAQAAFDLDVGAVRTFTCDSTVAAAGSTLINNMTMTAGGSSAGSVPSPQSDPATAKS